jgi:hypothetical protein
MQSGTIADMLTASERGNSKTNQPDFPALGTAYLNDLNIIGATIALFKYCSKFSKRNRRAQELPCVVTADDARRFSKYFAQLVAFTWKKLRVHAMLHPSPRSP